MLRFSLLMAKMKRLDPSCDERVILAGYFTKDGKAVPKNELMKYVTATKRAWIDHVCDRIEKDFATLLASEPQPASPDDVGQPEPCDAPGA